MRNLRQTKTFLATSFVAVALALLIAGCGSSGGDSDSSSGGGGGGGIFRYGFPGELDSTNPFVSQSLPGIAIRTQIYPELVQYDENMELIGDLAKSWSASPDGKTWTFELNSGGKWSDGEPLTAKDAAWTLNTIQKYRTGGAAQIANQIPTPIKSVTAPSDDKLVIEFAQRSATALGELQNVPILPEHVWAAQVTGKNGAGLKTFTNPAPIVSGGPVSLDEYTKGESAVFGVNPGYYGPKPKIDTLGFRFYSNADAMVAGLKANEIDGAASVPSTALSAFDGNQALEVNVGQSLAELLVEVNVNEKRPEHRELLDPRVREAMALSIDRENLNDVVYGGMAEPAGSVILPVTGEWYDESLEPPAFAPEEANKILDEAGYERGSDGTRVADGAPMSYELLTSPGLPAGEGRVVSILQKGLAEIGIKLTQRSLDINAFISALGDPNNTWTGYDFALVPSSFPVDPDQNLISFISSQRPQDGGFNWTSFNSPEFDRLYQEQRVEMDPEKRRKLVFEAQALLYEENPVLMLAYEPQIDVRSTAWTGFVPTPMGPISQFNKLTVERLHKD